MKTGGRFAVRMRLIACSVSVLLATSCTQSAPVAPAAPAAHDANDQKDARLRDLPAFGVLVPPSPDGFVESTELWSGLFAADVAAWKPSPPDNTKECIELMWRYMALGFGPEGTTDLFKESAVNPMGIVNPSDADFANVAREVPIRSICAWPTRRFVADKPDERGIIQTQAVTTNNICYVLIHHAPGGPSAKGRAAFDAIAAGVRFQPPAPLGKSMRLGTQRIPVWHVQGVSVLRIEPFRFVEFSGQAYDLCLFTQRPDQPAVIENYGAELVFNEGGRDLPDGLSGFNSDYFRDRAVAWLKDTPKLRIASPHIRNVGHGVLIRAYAGGRELSSGRWLWLALRAPQRVVDDAGGDDQITALVEATLASAEVDK